ncbi:MAG: hypothetical protein R3B57_04720 [Phycisphaerales bacterium]
MQGSNATRLAAACALVFCGSLASAREDDPLRILGDPSNNGIRDFAMLMSGFEQSEGWNLGLANASPPTGWSVLGATHSPIVSNLNPWVGAQHLRIDKETSLNVGHDIGVVSPHITLPDQDELEILTLKMGVYIERKGGADYDVFLQSSTALAARVKFDFTGRILVVDDLAFRDTGAEWTPGQWKQLRIELDYTGSGQAIARYYYGGALIWTDNNRFDLVDDPTQFGIVSDNFNMTDFGDFDGVMLMVPSPGSIATAMVGVALVSTRRRRR